MDFLNFAQNFAQQAQQPEPAEDFDPVARSEEAIPADVRMFSGCEDAQTSADVHDVASFGLPENVGPGGAGGACTNSMISTLENNPNVSWVELLQKMRVILKQKGFAQIPQLSSSRSLDMSATVDFTRVNSANNKALLIGINYTGQKGELRGCVNDVLVMKQMLQQKGFSDDDDHMRVLVDDDSVSPHEPNYQNIIQAFRWFVTGVGPEDSLFFHYSGHGGQMADDDGDEKDGKDETIIPVDYTTAGQMRDDIIFEKLIAPLPKGVQLTVVMDCCHSGTVLDLPYMFKADDGTMEQLFQDGEDGPAAFTPNMTMNPQFNWEKVGKVAMKVWEVYQSGGGMHEMASGALGAFFQ